MLHQHGAPAIVVSNAGAFLLRPLEATEAEELETQLAVNVRAPFAVAKAFLPAMREAGRGTFITVGSVADHVGFPENAAYAASKYGLRGLHETLVAEYKGTGFGSPWSLPAPPTRRSGTRSIRISGRDSCRGRECCARPTWPMPSFSSPPVPLTCTSTGYALGRVE